VKFLTLKLNNFQSASSLSLDFSTDPEKKLTVVRAENGFGKTTLHCAFRWAVFGKAGLNADNRGIEKIGHFDTATEEGVTKKVQVDLTFQTSPIRGNPQKYRIVRHANVNVKKSQEASGDWVTYESRIGGEALELLHEEGGNWNSVDHAETKLRTFFPEGIKDIFFVDGDHLTELIQVDGQKRMYKVEKSISYLLELDRYENAVSNVNKVRRQFDKQTKNDSSGELNRVLTQIEQYEEVIDDEKKVLEKVIERTAIERIELSTSEKAYADALRSGDARKLESEKQTLLDEKKGIQDEIKDTEIELRKLLSDKSLFVDLLQDGLKKSRRILEKEKKDNRFPKDALAVIKDLMEQDECLCGEKLDSSADGKQRKKHLKHLLKQNEEESKLSEKWSESYYYDLSTDKPWMDKLNLLREKEDTLRANLANKEAQITRKEQEISACDASVDLDALQKRVKDSQARLSELKMLEGTGTNNIENNERELRGLNALADDLRKGEGASQASHRRASISKDLMFVLHQTQVQLKQLVRKTLSDSMSDIFREMTLQDEQTANYSGITINEDYDLRVISANTNAALSFDQINGSALRALTMSFVMSLVNTSDFKAPVLIDNPGASSAGDIKKAIVGKIIEDTNADQIILFLYRDEIDGVEDIINKYSDAEESQYTISHPKGFPRYIKNDEITKDGIGMINGLQSMYKCNCGISEDCKTCELH